MAAKKRKKNPGVGIDFKRAKLKVGKKLPKARNATDTNFKAQSISLPGQNALTEDRSGLAVSDRNLTLKELLGQVGHYSERVRKDALTGLASLLTSHPEELKRQAGPVMERLAERVSDAESEVRAGLLGLLRDVVLPGLGPSALAPFLPLLMAHVTAAMTHLADAVRADALGFLGALMAAAPRQVAGGFLPPALQHYGHLLAPSQRARSVKAGSLKSLLQVVEALRGLLQQAAAAVDEDMSGDARPAASGSAAEEQPAASTSGRHDSAPLFAGRCAQPPRALQHAPPPALLAQCLQRLAASGGLESPKAAKGTPLGKQGAEGSKDPQQAAVDALLGHLLDAWAECTPGQLSAEPEAAAVAACAAILDCTRLLLARLPPEAARGWAAAVIRKVAPHVPVSAPVVRAPAPVLAGLVQVNICAAQLLTTFLPAAQEAAAGEAGWMDRLLDFYEAVLVQGQVLPASGGLGQAAAQPAIPADVYSTVLAGVQHALPALAPGRRRSLLGAVRALAGRVGAGTPVRAACLRFQGAFLSCPDTLQADPATVLPLIDEAEAASWLQGLPQLLWELGGSQPATSLAALRMLHDAGRYAQPGGPIADALQALQPKLAPLYASALPAASAGKKKQQQKGSTKACGKGAGTFKRGDGREEQGTAQKDGCEGPQLRLLAGPLAQLPPQCQELAVDLACFYPVMAEATLRALCLLCLAPTYPAALATRAIAVLQHAASASQVAPDAFLSLLLSLLTGRSAQLGPHALDQSCTRARHVVGAACRALQAFPGGAAVALVCLGPALLRQYEDAVSMRGVYGPVVALAAGFAAVEDSDGAQHGSDEIRQQLLQLGCALQPVVAEYAISVLEGAEAGGQLNSTENSFELAPILALLLAAPGLLGPFLRAVAAAAAQAGSARALAAMRLLCEVLGVQGLQAALLEQQAEVTHATEALREAGAVPAKEPTLLGRAVADAGARLEGMRRTLYGLDLQ